MGKFEADGVKIDMLFGCPPLFVFPARKKEFGGLSFLPLLYLIWITLWYRYL